MKTMNPATVRFEKFEARARVSDSSFAAKVNQLGINMVDLMMWLVIAALLLAAALQGIGFYQKAAWNYQLNSDASAVRTYMEAQYTLNSNKYPTQAEVVAAAATADLKLTKDNNVSNVVTSVVNTSTGGWTAVVCSAALSKSGVTNDAITIYSDMTKNLPVNATC